MLNELRLRFADEQGLSPGFISKALPDSHSAFRCSPPFKRNLL
jgi:hypothetical protein